MSSAIVQVDAGRTFDFAGLQLRVELDDAGEAWFRAGDVCTALGYTNAGQTVADHCDVEDVSKRYTLSNGGKQLANFINESGLYALCFGSKLESAKRFKRWVTSEVLPAIRKTGSYGVSAPAPMPALPKDYKSALRALADEVEAHEVTQQRVLAAEAELEAVKPKVEVHDQIMKSTDTFSVGEAAQIIGIMSGPKMFKWLRAKGYLHLEGKPRPREEFLRNGTLDLQVTQYRDEKSGALKLTSQVRVTVRGLVTLREHMEGDSTIEPSRPGLKKVNPRQLRLVESAS